MDIRHFIEAHRPSYKDRLTNLLKDTYPYPPNPVASRNASLSTVEEALKEAGYKDFKLFVDTKGIWIERLT